ncbi:MAG: endolytic transglycosylase MltG [bacterium]|nr:endolytic transglycosylase MltG [bacterium]
MALRIKIFPLIILGLIIVFLLWIPYYIYMLGPAVSIVPTLGLSEPVRFSITKGEGVRAISTALQHQELIKSAQFFRFYAFLSGQAHQLKPGVYEISPASSTPEIAKQIVSGPANEVEIRIIEGATLREIDAQLAQAGVMGAGEMLNFKITSSTVEYPFLEKAKSYEGFLFPDTYRFYYDSKPEAVIKAMLDNFGQKVAQIIIDSRKSFNDVLTIASMIEKEIPDHEDRKLVAGIIYKRLSIDMPLQIDATLAYAKLNGELYDTYQRYGLPPGPIGNPGLDAIAATLAPKTSNYFYYLSDPDTGKTIFSKTFEEHVANKVKYLR